MFVLITHCILSIVCLLYVDLFGARRAALKSIHFFPIKISVSSQKRAPYNFLWGIHTVADSSKAEFTKIDMFPFPQTK